VTALAALSDETVIDGELVALDHRPAIALEAPVSAHIGIELPLLLSFTASFRSMV